MGELEMADDDNGTKQKLYEAVSSLVGAGTMQERLVGVMDAIHPLQQSRDNPDSLQPELDALVEQLRDGEQSDEVGAVIARRVFSLFVKEMGGL